MRKQELFFLRTIALIEILCGFPVPASSMRKRNIFPFEPARFTYVHLFTYVPSYLKIGMSQALINIAPAKINALPPQKIEIF